MANFPTSLDDSSSLPNPGSTDKTNSPSHAGLHDAENAAIIAAETKLGTGASTPTVSKLLFGTGTGTSAWMQLTSSQLAASLSDETGSGLSVFGTTPTLVTPKIDTINESTPGNGTTIGGVNIKSGALVTSNSVVTTNITNTSVTASKLNLGPVVATVATNETTTSTSYTDLSTTSDTVTATIGVNGFALIVLTVDAFNNTNGDFCFMSFAASGANTIAAADTAAYVNKNVSSGQEIAASWVKLFSGLTAGSTTFKLKYRVNAGTGNFSNRSISVIPL